MSTEPDRLPTDAALLALEHSEQGVLQLDGQGCVRWANQRMQLWLGQALPQLLGQTLPTLVDFVGTDLDWDAVHAHAREAGHHRTELAWGHAGAPPQTRPTCLRIEVLRQPPPPGQAAGWLHLWTDTSALQQAQQASLAAAQDAMALRQTVDLHAIVSVADRRGRIVQANDAFCRVSGYTREQLIGQNHRVLNSGTHPRDFWHSMWSEIAKGRPWRGEVCNRKANGELYWVDSMIAPFVGPDGVVQQYMSVRVEITDRVLAQRQLDRQTRLLRSLVDAAPFGLALFDSALRLQMHNLRLVELLGLQNQHVLAAATPLEGNERWQFERSDTGFDPSFDEHFAELCRRAVEGQSQQLRRWQRGGLCVELGLLPLHDGNYLLHAQDVTEIERSRSQLLDAQERVRLATEIAGIGIWVNELTEGGAHWDPQQARMYGYKPEEVATTDTRAWERRLHPEDRAEAIARFEHSVENGQVYAAQFRIVLPDGRVRVIRALGSPHRDERGQVDYIVGTNQDVTEEVALAEATEQARVAAEAAVRTRSQFLANMSHELRTPISAIMGLLTLLEPGLSQPRERELLETAHGSAQMMARLVNNLLDFSRLEAGQLALQAQSFALPALLEELCNTLRAHVQDRDVDVWVLDRTDAQDLWRGDRQRLLQVLFNLVHNALRFTHSGEVVCSVRLQGQDGARTALEFAVEDTGMGVAPENVQRIFEGFSQVQDADARLTDGAGLGLGISARLVRLMGSELQLHSRLGEGSRFAFTVSLERQPGEHQAPELPPPGRALVVGGSAAARQRLCDLLATMGWTAEPWSSTEALEQHCLAAGPDAAGAWDWLLLQAEPEPAAVLARLQRLAPLQGAQVLLWNRQPQAQPGPRLQQLHMPFSTGGLRHALGGQDGPLPSRTGDHRGSGGRLAGMRVLVVDDGQINRKIAEVCLARAGAQVQTVDSGLEAIKAVEETQLQRHFDAILMDLQMPGMDGYACTAWLRRELGVTQPILALTANDVPDALARCAETGMQGLVGKPFDFGHLVDTLAQACQWQTPALRGSGAAPAVVPAASAGPLPPDVAAGAAAPPCAVELLWITAQPLQADALGEGVRCTVVADLAGAEQAAASLPRSGCARVLVMDAAVEAAVGHPEPEPAALSRPWLQPWVKLLRMEQASEALLLDCVRAGVHEVLPLAWRPGATLPLRHVGVDGALLPAARHALPGIASAREMPRMQADAEFFGLLLRTFVDEVPARLADLGAHWPAQPQRVASLCHALKSVARSLGMDALGDCAAATEKAAAAATALWHHGLWETLEAEIWSARYQALRWLHLAADTNG